jgi:hypothetical protein
MSRFKYQAIKFVKLKELQYFVTKLFSFQLQAK